MIAVFDFRDQSLLFMAGAGLLIFIIMQIENSWPPYVIKTLDGPKKIIKGSLNLRLKVFQ